MTIPKVNINDLLTSTQTANPSAGMTPNPDPIGGFIGLLSKYASQAGQAIQKNPIVQQVEQSPIGQLVQGKVGNVVPALKEEITQGTIGGKPYNPQLNIGGEMEEVPGGGASEGGLPPIDNASEEPAVEKPPMITKNKLDPDTLKKMYLNFDQTRVKTQNAMVKPDTIMSQLAEDGITGRSLDDLQNTAESITGEKGAMPMINNHILQSIQTPVDYTPAIESLQTNLPAVLDGEKPGFINEVTKEINKQLDPLNYNKPGELPSTMPEGQAYATDLFQASQNLRDIARMYQRKAYTQAGELNHPEFERAADAIMEIKNNIDDSIDKAVPSTTYQSFKTDPYVQEQLQRMPPAVAQRWLDGAQRFKDGQTIQAPYVNLMHLIEDTKNTQLSVWTKAAKAMQDQQASRGIGQTVSENIPGPKILKNAVGGVAETLTKPFDKTSEDIFEENMKGESNPSAKMKMPRGKTAKVIAGLGAAGAAGAALESMESRSKAQSDNHTNNSDNSHVNNNTTLETDLSKIDPKSQALDPRTVTGSDGRSLAMSDGQYQTAMAKLDALTKTDPSYITNPIKAGQLKAAQDAIKTKYAASGKLMDSYQKVQTAQQKITDAQDLLKSGAPWLTDAFGPLEAIHRVQNPQYQALINDLQVIENTDPQLKGTLSNLGTAESVKTALNQAAKALLSQHNQLLKSYGISNENPAATPTGTTPPPSQIPEGLPAPVDGALPAMHNGSYQFTPPNPLFQ